MTRHRGAVALLWIGLTALFAPAPAAAAPEPPRHLEVLDDPGWHAQTEFRVGWENPPAPDTPLTAAHYLLRNEAGTVVEAPDRTKTPVQRLYVTVPAAPGAYELEVWLEDRSGAQGPPTSTLLRFDDERPGPAVPLPHRGWIGRDELPLQARIAHPTGAQPKAGIRGYAVSLDRDPDGRPCAAAEICDEDETDLRGGIGDDAFSAENVPEGLSYLHAVAVSGSGVSSADPGGVPLRVDLADPVTRLAGLPDGWVDRAVALRAIATDADSGMEAAGTGDPFTAISVDGGPPSTAPGPTATATVIGSGVHTVAYYARDAAGNVDDGAKANGRRNAAPALAEVRIDRDPPSLAFLPSTHPADPELLEARVSDRLSGPDAARGWIGVRSAGSGTAFEPLPTAAGDGILRARWNSDEYPPGEYEFVAVGRDRAGNVASGTRRAGGAPMLLPSPLKTPTALTARLGSGRGATHGVPYGRGATYRGRLALGTGTPLGGLPVRVVERFAAGAGLEPRVTQVLTGPAGRFALHLAPGPSREVLAFFAGSPTRARAAAAPRALAVRSGLRLRASASAAVVGGRPLVFRGRIAGEVPAGGLAVALQFRLPGQGPWTEFRTLHSDGNGRFRYPYRFSDDDSRGVRFLFRAIVDAQAGWPYEPGASLPIAVRGE